MSNKFFDPSIKTGETDEMDGDSRQTAFPMHQFSSKYTGADKANPGDIYYIGTDPQRLGDYYRSTPYTLNRSTTQNGETEAIQFFFGSWGAFNDTFTSQDAFYFVGDRPSPHFREDKDGENLFNLPVDYYIFNGLRARNYKNVFNTQNGLTGLRFYDCVVQNVSAFLYPASTNSSYALHDVEIDGLHAINASVGLCLFVAGSSDITIRNFSCFNNAAEDGEFRGLNFFENCSNILIEDGEIVGGVDNWIGLDPKYGYGEYTQGDGISIEESNVDTSAHPYFKGFIAIVRRVKFSAFTDRAIDIKARALIEDCSVYNAKRGITLWGSGSIARRCIVKSARRAGNNRGICYLIAGDDITLENCYGMNNYSNNDGVVQISAGKKLTVIGGEYYAPTGRAIFKMLGSGCTLILIDVLLNGQRVSESFLSDAAANYPLITV